MSVKPEMDAFRSEFMAQAPSEVRDAMVRADILAAQHIIKKGEHHANISR